MTQMHDDVSHDVHSLELTQVMTSDAGRYDVIANNVMGDVRVTCTLGVRQADFRQLR